jgi:hypothetical protein
MKDENDVAQAAPLRQCRASKRGEAKSGTSPEVRARKSEARRSDPRIKYEATRIRAEMAATKVQASVPMEVAENGRKWQARRRCKKVGTTNQHEWTRIGIWRPKPPHNARNSRLLKLLHKCQLMRFAIVINLLEVVYSVSLTVRRPPICRKLLRTENVPHHGQPMWHSRPRLCLAAS